jgi:hypothetical protein
MAAVLAAAVPATAAASERGLGVVVVADPPVDAAVEAVSWGIERGAEKESWRAQRLVDGELGAALSRCGAGDAACRASALAAARPPVVLFVRVRLDVKTEGESVLDGRLIERSTGETSALSQRYCKKCGLIEVTDLGADLASELLRTRARRDAPGTAIRVVATPRDASVFIDDVRAGSPGQTHRLAPGPHVIRVERDGYLTATRTVTAIEGSAVPVDIVLVPMGEAGPPPWRRWGPWALGAAGLAGVGLGIGYFAMHQEAASGARENPFSRDARTHGIVATTVGVALIGGAALWWWIDGRGGPASEARDAQVFFFPSERGGYVSWTVDF